MSRDLQGLHVILGHGGGHHHGGGGGSRFYGRRPWGAWEDDDDDYEVDILTILGEVGLDINQVNKAVRGAKPMSAAQARKFIALALGGLADAEAHDPNGGSGATSRRVTLGNHLRSASTIIDSTKVDPLPESAAELLRGLVLQAVEEYNAVAEGNETLRAARAQFFQDVYDNAMALAKKAGAALDDTVWYAKATVWAVIGASVIGLGLVGWGIHSGVKSRISGR